VKVLANQGDAVLVAREDRMAQVSVDLEDPEDPVDPVALALALDLDLDLDPVVPDLDLDLDLDLDPVAVVLDLVDLDLVDLDLVDLVRADLVRADLADLDRVDSVGPVDLDKVDLADLDKARRMAAVLALVSRSDLEEGLVDRDLAAQVDLAASEVLEARGMNLVLRLLNKWSIRPWSSIATRMVS
jgi:hypothetical protein